MAPKQVTAVALQAERLRRDRERTEQTVRDARQTLAHSRRERARIGRTLRNSERSAAAARQVLRRAGLLK